MPSYNLILNWLQPLCNDDVNKLSLFVKKLESFVEKWSMNSFPQSAFYFLLEYNVLTKK